MGKATGNARMRWREDCIKCFLESCIHEVTRLDRKEGGLHKRSWMYVKNQLQEVCDLKVTQKQMRNVYDYLKWKFFGWAYLNGNMGHLYNAETNTFNLTDDEWRDFIEDHPKAKTLRSSPLIFPELCALLYERTFTLGELRWSPTSTKLSRSPVSPSSPDDQLLAIEDVSYNSQEDGTDNPSTSLSPNTQLPPIEAIPINYLKVDTEGENPCTVESPKAHIPETEDIRNDNQEGGTQNPVAQCSQSTTSVPLADREIRPHALNGDRPKKKGKTFIDERPLKRCKTTTKVCEVEDVSDALKVITKSYVSQLENISDTLKVITKSHVGPSQKECIDKLNQLGWAKDCDSYVAALGIFCEGPSYREGWMLLPMDNHELINRWVSSVGKKLGYM